jgi:hypothetical protein
MKLALRPSRIKTKAQSLFFRWTYDWRRSAPAPDHIVVLFFNGMWERTPSYPADELPDDCEITMDKRRMREATAVVFHIPSLGSLGRVKKFPGQVWVAWSMECEAHYPQLLDRRFMSRFDLTMTYHRNADLSVPYYSPHFEHLLLTPPKTHDKLAAFFASGRHDRSGRIAYAAEIMHHIEVHSYGRQLRNRSLARDNGRATKLETIAAYQFTLAFENAIAPDYVTEKFFDPLIVGSVPVYLGAPNMAEFAPGERCYIDASKFESPRALAEYLLHLDANDAAYREYLAWKQSPLRPDFLALLDEQRAHPFVRLCQKLRDLKARSD